MPVVKPGMAIIRKLRVDAASSMHSLPGPVAVDLYSFQRCDCNPMPLKHSQDTTQQADMPTASNCQNNANRPILNLLACTCFQTMPKPASTAGGLDPSQPLPRCVQHQCFFEGDHASVGTGFDVGSLNLCQLQMFRTIAWMSQMTCMTRIPCIP